MNKLYVASVPIGNLKESSKLLIETFEKVNVIFCEDTRTTHELMKKLDINNKPKLISCHKYNENNRVECIISELKNHDAMLVSDAGYPTISDPGNFIITELISHGVDIQVINGPTALIHALIKSGYNTSKFSFLGFLDNRKKQQINTLLPYKNIDCTIILYESVHRLKSTLENLKEIFPNTNICVCKELTKKFETFWYSNTNEILSILDNQILKGEFVILIDNNFSNKIYINNEEWKLKIDKLRKYNLTNKDILEISEELYPDISKKAIYNYILGKDDE